MQERHLIINGVTIYEDMSVVALDWHWYVSSSEPTAVRYKCMCKLVRGETKYICWVARSLTKEPNLDSLRGIAKEHYDYTLNPFGLPDNA